MSTGDERRAQDDTTPSDDSLDAVDPLEPVADDSVLADMPDTTTGKQQLTQGEEGRPGTGV